MDDDITRPPETTKRRQRRGFGAGFALVGLLVTVGLLAAACGGGSKDPGAASGSGTTTTVAPGGKTGAPASSGSSTTQAELLQLAQCMRSHGVPNFPDPSATEGTLRCDGLLRRHRPPVAHRSGSAGRLVSSTPRRRT